MRKSKAVAVTPESHEMLDERVARKAYELYEQRGGSHGRDLDDWLAAERIVRAEAEEVPTSSPPRRQRKVVSIRKKTVDFQ